MGEGRAERWTGEGRRQPTSPAAQVPTSDTGPSLPVIGADWTAGLLHGEAGPTRRGRRATRGTQAGGRRQIPALIQAEGAPQDRCYTW